MARMEELLNAIDRFLDEPEFRDRLLADAREFHTLLHDSKGLYPTELPKDEQPWFDQAIDETVATSVELLAALKESDSIAARQKLVALQKQRIAAHARFSH